MFRFGANFLRSQGPAAEKLVTRVYAQPSFRERYLAEACFPRRPLLGSSANKGNQPFIHQSPIDRPTRKEKGAQPKPTSVNKCPVLFRSPFSRSGRYS